jgi:hypothetical protein
MKHKHWVIIALLAACNDVGAGVQDAAYSRPLTQDEELGPNGRPIGVEDCFTAESKNHPATRAFWAAFGSSDYAQRDSVIEQLSAAATAQPEQEQFAFLLGHASLWRVAENRGLQDLLLMLSSVETAEREFARAYALCPSDVRITAWLGPVKIILGNLLGDSQRVADGKRLLAEGTARYPAFVTFSNALAFSGAGPSDPEFKILEDTANYYAALAESGADTNCVLAGAIACINTAETPRNIEGTALYIGDLFVKTQDRENALKAYKIAEEAPDLSSWSFRPLLDERIKNIDANMAAAGNALELDDPAWAWTSNEQCSYCHRQ